MDMNNTNTTILLVSDFVIYLGKNHATIFNGFSCHIIQEEPDFILQVKINPTSTYHFFEIEFNSNCVESIEQFIYLQEFQSEPFEILQSINNEQSTIIPLAPIISVGMNHKFITHITFDMDHGSINYAELYNKTELVARFSQQELLDNDYKYCIKMENYLIPVANDCYLKIYFNEKITAKIYFDIKYLFLASLEKE